MIRILNFDKALLFENPDIMTFVRPIGSNLYRVRSIPLSAYGNPEEEIAQVLTTFCKKYHDKIWYFRIPDQDTQQDISDTLHLMGVPHLYVTLDGPWLLKQFQKL